MTNYFETRICASVGCGLHRRPTLVDARSLYIVHTVYRHTQDFDHEWAVEATTLLNGIVIGSSLLGQRQGPRITHERSNIVISWAFRSSHRRLKLLCLGDPPLRRAGSDKGVSERPRAL